MINNYSKNYFNKLYREEIENIRNKFIRNKANEFIEKITKKEAKNDILIEMNENSSEVNDILAEENNIIYEEYQEYDDNFLKNINYKNYKNKEITTLFEKEISPFFDDNNKPTKEDLVSIFNKFEIKNYLLTLNINTDDNRITTFEENFKSYLNKLKINKKENLRININIAFKNVFRETLYDPDNIKHNVADFKILNIINEREKDDFNEDEKRDIIYILQKYTIFVPNAIKNIKEY
ncbi:hypothetical protein U3516DRAFT_751415 [Neocallimastix sp. 'constans']